MKKTATALGLFVGAWCLFADQAVGLPGVLVGAANLHRTWWDRPWSTYATFIESPRTRLFALDLLVRTLLGLGLPLLWAAARNKSLHDLMVWPRTGAFPARATAGALGVAVAAGLVMHALGARPRWEPALGLAALGVIPQHVFIFGWGLALLRATADRGKAQLPRGADAVAVLVTGGIFGLTHLGRAFPAEVALSLPGGVLCAWVTWRARSVWPAAVAHVTMNGVALLAGL